MSREESFSAKNYSIEANFQALVDLVKDNPELWTDQYLIGTGAQLLRVIAAGQSANGVRTLQALYETFIGHMQRRDSMLGFGETMGYSAFRGSNDIITIVAIANEPLSIPARQIIGNVKGTHLINVNSIVANAGQTFSFQAKVGNLRTENRSVTDTEYKYVRFLSENISDDVLLFINDEPIDYKTTYKDVANAFNSDSTLDKAYVLLTNAYGSVDVFILNRGALEDVAISDVFTLNFIEYTNLNYLATDVVFNYGIIKSVTLKSSGEPAQSVESMRATIPYFRDTQREVLANRDPMKVLRLLMPNVESTAGTNLNTVHSLLSYKYTDYHLVPDSQLKEYESSLVPIYYFGFCPSNIVQPIQYKTSLDIEVVLFTPKTENLTIEDYLKSVLSQYEKLPITTSFNFTEPINLDNIESELNKFNVDGTDIIKTAYVNVSTTPIEANTRIQVGTFYKEDEKLYQVRGFVYNSGGNIPTEFLGQYTPCGNILLEKWRLIYGYKPLIEDTYYSPDDIVGISDTQIFRVHPNYILPSTQPEWNPEIGAYTYSGDFIWLTIKYVAGTSYDAGSYAIKGMIVTPEDSEVSYQLIGFSKTVDTLNTEGIVSIEFDNKPRELTNLWNSYTVFSIGNLNIHV